MELNYKSFGSGFPIIILHGLFGTLDNWQTIAKRLAEHFLVYIVDQRNHGRSPHDKAFNYEVMAEDLLLFLEKQWIYEAHIIGHSMGGKTAMHFALNYADLVKKLIVVDIAPKAYPKRHTAIFEALFSLDLAKISSRKEAANLLQQKIRETSVSQFLLKNLSRNKEGSYEWKMNLPAIYTHYAEILAPVESEQAFDNPVLFIRGGQSTYIQDADWEKIELLFPNAKLETIPRAGHWVHSTAPNELLQLVKNFLFFSA